MADRIGAPISARLAQLQQSSASDQGTSSGSGADHNQTSMSAVADRLVDNEEFLDSIIKNLEDVSLSDQQVLLTFFLGKT